MTDVKARDTSASALAGLPRQALAQFARYAVVGAVCGAVYTIVVLIIVERGFGSASMASAFGYAVAIPVSYLGHRWFTFRSRQRWLPEWGRFLLVQAVCIALAFVIMHVATGPLAWPLWTGIALCVALLPLGGFVAMRVVVFVAGNLGTQPGNIRS